MNRKLPHRHQNDDAIWCRVKPWLLVTVFFAFAASLDAQDTTGNSDGEPTSDTSVIDNIFDGTQTDTTVNDTGSLLDEFEKPQPLGFSVDVSSAVLLYGGLSDLDTPLGTGDSPVIGGGYSLSNTLGFSAKLDKTLKFQGGIAFSYPDYVVTIDNISFDYTLLDTVYFKGGKFGFTWGNGRFFNIGNLADGIGNGIALRVYIPIDVLGWTVAVYAEPGFFADTSNPSPSELGYASLLELSVPGIEFTLSARYQKTENLSSSAGIKTAVAGLDLFAEARADFPADFLDPGFSVMGGFFYEWKDPKLRLYGEYLWAESDKTGWDYGDNQSSIALKWHLPNSPNMQLGLQWSHEWADGSGAVVAGLSFDPVDHISVNLGLPIRYGTDGSYYRGATPPGFDTAFPSGQVLLLCEVKLSGTFR